MRASGEKCNDISVGVAMSVAHSARLFASGRYFYGIDAIEIPRMCARVIFVPKHIEMNLLGDATPTRTQPLKTCFAALIVDRKPMIDWWWRAILSPIHPIP